MNWEIEKVKETSSTNDLAKAHIKNKTPAGLVIMAERQTKGKGRLNRKWFSPAGGLWATLILQPNIQPVYFATLNIVAGIAIVKALHRYHIIARVKWPNDIVINGKKVAGILSELVQTDLNLPFVIVGIGLNVNFPIEHLPPSIREKSTTLQEEIKSLISLDQLLNQILKEFDLLYLDLVRGDISSIKALWRTYSYTFQKQVTITINQNKISGIVEDITDRGELLLRTRKEVLRCEIGDISIHNIYPKN